MRHAIDFMRDAIRSGAHLYKEVALSALQLVPELSAQLRVSSRTRPWSEIRSSMAVAQTAVPLPNLHRSPQSL